MTKREIALQIIKSSLHCYIRDIADASCLTESQVFSIVAQQAGSFELDKEKSTEELESRIEFDEFWTPGLELGNSPD